MKYEGKNIYVGLSGGVDSAVTAALLKQKGAKVTGVFIQGWYPPGMPCTWREDRLDAMRVAARLQIPFITLDASSEYKKGVIDYLLAEYKAGRTPNPDVMCNREVKFGAFYRYAREAGADFIATGHYAQVVHTNDGPQLLRGRDASKDQSYFLWAVPRAALAHTLFPLGALHKNEVRRIAGRFDLPNAQKKDSQGICFLGSISVEDFLRAEFGSEVGKAYDEEGNEVGEHNGALLHTLGERIALSGSVPGPWYVQSKDIASNTLRVSHSHQPAVVIPSIRIRETNWLTDSTVGESYQAQYRYHGQLIEGALDEERTVFTPLTPLPENLASGQSLVIYKGEECIGGGIIS